MRASTGSIGPSRYRDLCRRLPCLDRYVHHMDIGACSKAEHINHATVRENEMNVGVQTRSLGLLVALGTLTALLGAGRVHAAGAPLYPDIVEQMSHLQIQNEHQREMLR